MPIMDAAQPDNPRRRGWLAVSRDTCTGLAACGFAAVLGFLAARGPGRGLDTSGPLQPATAATTVLLTLAAFVLWAIMIHRNAAAAAVAATVRAEQRRVDARNFHLDRRGPGRAVATAPAGRNRDETTSG